MGDGVGAAVVTVVGRVVGTTLAAGISGAVTGDSETAGSDDDVIPVLPPVNAAQPTAPTVRVAMASAMSLLAAMTKR
jgi:hypothetical protein